MTDLLANRRIPGEVKRIVRPILESFVQPNSDKTQPSEVSVEEVYIYIFFLHQFSNVKMNFKIFTLTIS